MSQILHASFWKFSKLLNSGISLSWSITDEVTTCNTTAYFGPLSTFIDTGIHSICSNRYNVIVVKEYLKWKLLLLS